MQFSLQNRNYILLLQCQKRQHKIGLWCNGNTTDSGPVILGSNPGSPTKKREQPIGCSLFCWATRSYIYNPSKPPFDKGGLWQCSALLAVGKIQNIYPTYRLYCLLVEPI